MTNTQLLPQGWLSMRRWDWESHFLDRLIRSPGSPEKEIEIWKSQGGGKDRHLFFFSTFLSLSHITDDYATTQLCLIYVLRIIQQQCILLEDSFSLLKSKCQSPSLARLFVTSWTAAHQALLSMRFSRQGDWSGFPFPSPGDLPDPGTKPGSLSCRQISLLTELQGKPFLKTSWLILLS